jgi:nucleoside-diphosphate-sugar epimerase
MKVLIIGGTGLISTAISRQLLERSDDVTLYNRGKSEVRFEGGAKFLNGDRKEYAAFEAQMADAGTFDCVIDMIGFVPQDVESSIRAFRGRIGHYVFCSTVCVYGGMAAHYPIREDEERTPTGSYGANKTLCEATLLAADHRGDFRVTVMRPSQTYGEGGNIVHSLGWRTTYLDRIRKGKPIIVHGDGSCLWAACHVDDVARGFIGALSNPAAYGKSYNVTGEEWMTWNQYHQGVAKALDAPEPTLVHIPTDVLGRIAPKRASISVDIFQYPSVFDNSAAVRDLGFKYTVPWVEGVRRTVAFLDARGRIEDSNLDPLEDRILEAWGRLTDEMAQSLFGLEG